MTSTFLDPLIQLSTALRSIIPKIDKEDKEKDAAEGFATTTTTTKTTEEETDSERNWRYFIAIITIIMIVPIVIVWVRLFYTAFKIQGIGQGVFAFFLPQLYVGWTLATLVSTSLKKGLFS